MQSQSKQLPDLLKHHLGEDDITRILNAVYRIFLHGLFACIVLY
jgi:hypothetical protein